MRKLYFALLFLFCSFSVQALDGPMPVTVTVTGPASVVAGQTYTYTGNSSSVIMDAHWTLSVTTVGHVVSSSSSGTTYTVSVMFDAAGTTNVQILDGTNAVLAYKTATSTMPTPPSAPASTFTTVNNCGNTVVTRVGTVPSGVIWYWQTSSSGTLTSNSTANYTLSATGTIYLRAMRTVSPFDWSSAQTVGPYTVNTMPSAPPASTNTSGFAGNAVTYNFTAGSGATSYRWYLASSGGTAIATTASNSWATTIPGASATYYISSVNGACETTTRKSLAVTAEPLPVIVIAGDGQPSITFGNSISMSPTLTYPTYSWKNKANTSVGTSQSLLVTTPDTYSLTVTKSGINGTGTSKVIVGTGLSGQAIPNYVASNTPRTEISNPARLALLAVDSVIQQVQYLDDFGRPKQNITTQGSVSKKDIVATKVYDAYSREARTYLPFAAQSSGWVKDNVIDGSGNFSGAALNFYNNGSTDKIADDARPFSETVFEASPLNRPSRSFGQGQNWKDNDKATGYNYVFNKNGTAAGEEQIIAWTVTSGMPVRVTTTNTYTSGGYYTTGQLTVKSTTDEDGRETREYTDRSGHVILKKVQAVTSSPSLNDPSHYTQTYYIYDDVGNLRFVFQPELSKFIYAQAGGYNPTATDLSKLAFVYRYDKLNRMIVKKVPGADSVFTVYDKRNRPVMTQDGIQRPLKQWIVTKYDTINRPVMTALYTHGTVITQAAMTLLPSVNRFCETYNHTTTNFGYTLRVWPTSSLKVLSVTYYDNYDFITDLSLGSGYAYTTGDLSGQEAARNAAVSGKQTGGQLNILGSANYLVSSIYYDNKYRTIQSIAQNQLGGYDRSTTVLDFSGSPLSSKLTHKTTGHSDQVIAQRFTYDHTGRPVRVYHAVNGGTEIILLQNEYNELGQLIDKKLYSADAGSTFRQSTDMRYNIRGWLTSINNSQLTNDGSLNNDTGDLFGMELAYNTGFPTGSTSSASLYSGNISSMKWSTNLALGTVKDVAYNYSYDALNRLSSAAFLNHTASGWSNTTNQFSESGYTYDMNGNIKALVRKSITGGTMDNLTYNYSGNQLTSVADAGDVNNGFKDGVYGGTDFLYDVNGNMTWDNNKYLDSIKYDHLNLPTRVRSSSGLIVYTYDAGGRKLQQQLYASNGTTLLKSTWYAGDFIYEGTSSSTLQFIQHPEGRIVMTGANPEYQYHLKDHLGNVRLTFTATPPAVSTKTGTFESANVPLESGFFQNYPSGANLVMNATMAHSGSYSERLNGAASSQVGVAKSYSVMPGDVVSISAYGKYTAPSGTTSNLTGFATALLNAFSLTAPGMGETGTARAAINSYGASEATGGKNGSTNTTDPLAFVTILIFDRNYTFLDVSYAQLTSASQMLATYTIKQPGYAYLYISNEQVNQTDVFFDDVVITMTPGAVVQEQDYYPFGLTFNSYSRENALLNKKDLFQGQEHVSDLGINWDSFKWRNHQPEIGRFFNLDPLSEKYYYNSLYAFSENRVVNGVELEGLEVLLLNEQNYHEGTHPRDFTASEQIVGGIGKVVGGTVGAVAAGSAAIGTMGASAFASGVVVGLSLGTAAIGIAQIQDGVTQLGTGEKTAMSDNLSNSSTLAGLASSNSEHHDEIEAGAAIVQDVMVGGIKTIDAIKKIEVGKVVFGTVDLIGTTQDMIEAKQVVEEHINKEK